MGFACRNCKSAVLLTHPETKQAQEGWLKCPLCGFCRKEKEDVQGSDIPQGDSEGTKRADMDTEGSGRDI